MVSALMEFVNALYERQRTGSWHSATFHQALNILMVLLAPSAPHIVEELWQLTGHSGSVHQQAWPAWDASLAHADVLQLPVQVNGKLRHVMEVAKDASQQEIQFAALAQPKVQQHLGGRGAVKIIYVPGKVLNIVTK
jgi:leucyl-tRNA synthetase